MAEQSRFDWGAIFRAYGVIVVGAAAVGFLVPLAVTLAFNLGHTGRASGHELYRWGFWAVAWGLTVWQGAWMLRVVHEKIVDDMIVTSVLAALTLFILRIVMALIYEPVNSRGELLPLITGIDTGGALILVVVALIGARVNKF